MQNIKNIINHIQNNSITNLSGLSTGVELYLLSCCTDFFVYITSSENLEKARLQLEIFGKKPVVFPYFCSDNKYSFSIDSLLLKEQQNALFSLQTESCDCLILQTEALFQKLPDVSVFNDNIIFLNVQNTYNLAELKNKLSNLQYTVVDKVESQGQMAIRGDIFDIFPVNSQTPYRLSFFDDELESIREFDIVENVSKNQLNSVKIAPNTLFLINQKQKQECIDKLNYLLKSNNLSANASARFSSVCSYCINNLSENQNANTNLWAQSVIFSNSIFDYIPQNSLIAYENKKQLYAHLENHFQEYEDNKRELYLIGECLPIQVNYQNLIQDLDLTLSKFKALIFNNFVFGLSSSHIELECLPIFNYKNKKETLIYDTKELLEQGYQVVIFCPSTLDENFLTEMFNKQFIHYEKLSDLKQIGDQKLYFYQSNLPYGVGIKNEKIAFLPCGEKNTKKVTYQKNKQVFFDLPKAGDYVVHDFHGIGLCQGIQTLEISNFKRDYIVIQYLGTDKFYLPVENADQLSKYIGQENPKLNKIGGAEFERAKNRVREQMELLAYDMLKIYYEREHSKGHQYQVDTFIDKEFADAFPYQETMDQLKAVEEIKADMSSPKIMDRLLCGDVGYGKTEVAFRTAMTAINNGKQVVMLVPTTILSEQHYRSAKARFSGFGVKIEVLNRFKTPKQVEEIYKKLANGEIDLLIGTQKVLNSSIKYKNLGLLILDEEQRLGVNDKETIKKLKMNLDVLSMSATPIPRTLNMALTGIRDISTISTPPKLRKSVETTIMEYSDGLIFNAVKQEIERDGQVLVITSRIDGIENIAGHIQKQFPDIVVAFAHARMTKLQLENITLKLYNGEIDVLVSTTLIENGIDLPNANTLIVLQADRFGLSQLYQLRGRVGRSDKQAYAYFCFDNFKTLSSDSSKRLQAIQDFTELGSGFQIAMRDLELRGAGTVLGEKQSGHLEKVGYDMYCKLLAQALDVAKGKQFTENIMTKMDVDINTDLPQWFISNETTRFEVINKISQLQSQDELINLQQSFVDMFGKLPASMINLMNVALTKNLAQFFAINQITIKSPNIFKATIAKNTQNSAKLCEFLGQSEEFRVINNNNMTIIIFNGQMQNTIQILENFKNLLQKCRINVVN